LGWGDRGLIENAQEICGLWATNTAAPKLLQKIRESFTASHLRKTQPHGIAHPAAPRPM
jgi:hypothetical protein